MAFMEGSRHAPPITPEFRARSIAIVRLGRQVKLTAADLGLHTVTLHNWLRQVGIDHGHRPSDTTRDSAELRAARGGVDNSNR